MALRRFIQPGWAVVIGFLVSAIPAAGLVSSALGRITRVSDFAREVVQRIDEQRQAPARAQQEALARLIDQYKEQIVAATARIELLEKSRSARAFIEQRHAIGEYRLLEGVVSSVRRDLEELSRLLTVRRGPGTSRTTAAGSYVPDVDRIILYIDDLDRCSSEPVVEVLQAIHLLLAFPLFVVVVGVDARWLLAPLQRHYDQLLGESRAPDNRPRPDSPGPGDPASTSYDYLEKIFQIPMCLRPMSRQGYAELIYKLAGSSASQRENVRGAAGAGPAPGREQGPGAAEAGTAERPSPAVHPDPGSSSPRSQEAGDADRKTESTAPVTVTRIHLSRHDAPVVAVGTDTRGLLLFSIATDGVMRSEDLLTRSGERETRMPSGAETAMIARCGKVLADDGSGSAAVIDARTLEVISLDRDERSTRRKPTADVISPDGRTVAVRWDAAEATSSDESAFSILNIFSSSKKTMVDEQTEPGRIHLLTKAWQLVSRGQQVSLKFAEPGQREGRVEELSDLAIEAAAADQAGTLLCIISRDKLAQVWEIEPEAAPGAPVFTENVPSSIVAVDGWRLAVADGPGFRVWNIRTSVPDLTHDTGMSDITCLHLTEDGRRLVTGHEDGTVAVWLIARPSTAAREAFRSLEFEDDEVGFLLKVQPLITTPRAAKRLTNLYRIPRAGLSRPERDELLGQDRGYHAAIIMLALLITSPETAAGLVYRIRFRSADQGKFTELAADHLAETRNKTRKSAGKGTSAERELNSLAHLEEQIRKVMGQDQVQDDLAVFRRWATPVARFSFRSDDHDASLR